jgi:hypothetical protein
VTVTDGPEVVSVTNVVDAVDSDATTISESGNLSSIWLGPVPTNRVPGLVAFAGAVSFRLSRTNVLN